MSNDTHNGGFLWFDPGEDHDDEFSSKGTYGDEKEKTYTYDELKEKINNSSMPQDIKDELLKKLKGASKK